MPIKPENKDDKIDSLIISLKTIEFLKKGKKIKRYPYTPDLHKKYIKYCLLETGTKND